jgi:hypothetical protein
MRAYGIVLSLLTLALVDTKASPWSSPRQVHRPSSDVRQDYPNFGDSKFKEKHGTGLPGFKKGCFFDDDNIVTDRCEGYPKRNFDTNETSAAMPKWLRSRGLHDRATSSLREDLDGGRVTRTIRAIKGPENYALRRLKDRGILIAVISGDPVSKKDKRYGIGGWSATDGYENNFYLVASGVTMDSPVVPVSRKIATWTLYGIRRNQLVEVSTGTLRWCEHDHANMDDLRKLGASFIACRLVPPLAEFVARAKVLDKIGKVSLFESIVAVQRTAGATSTISQLDADIVRTWANRYGIAATPADIKLLQDVFIDEPFAPAWVVCGIGCCTVE